MNQHQLEREVEKLRRDVDRLETFCEEWEPDHDIPSEPTGATIPSREGQGAGEGEKVAEEGCEGFYGRACVFPAPEKFRQEGREEARGRCEYLEGLVREGAVESITSLGLDPQVLREEMARERRRVSTWPPGTEREEGRARGAMEDQARLNRLGQQLHWNDLGNWKGPSRKGWYCECGATAAETWFHTPGDWRWAGDHWQHYHGYPVGHVLCYHPTLRPEPCTPPSTEEPTPDEISYQNSVQLLRLAALKFVNPRGRFEDLRPEINEILRRKYPSTEEMLSCTPPAPPPAAEPAEETSPGGERCTAGGAGWPPRGPACEARARFGYIESGLMPWSSCPWCGEKLGGEG